MSKLRSKRKKEHLILAMQGSRCSFTNLFRDIMLPHNCLTEINPDQVDLSAGLCGYATALPIYINAVTGGGLAVEHINRELAMLANLHSLPMAVGSQKAGLDSPRLRFTFHVVRKHNPDGLVMANLSATATPSQALGAIEMIGAQILQLHLNPAQELIMPEGDKIQPGVLENIAGICARVSVPVIVKEVGFGLAACQAKSLARAGVAAVDVSGTGGTNFALIEGARSSSNWWQPFTNWGIPTPLAIADVSSSSDLEILASGGVDDGLRALKCLALGASGVGIAGSLVRQLYYSGFQAGDDFIVNYIRQLRVGMALMGISNVAQLSRIPLLITGKLNELLKLKGIDPRIYSKQGK